MGNPQTVDVTNKYSINSRKLNAEGKVFRRKANEDKIQENAERQQLNDFCGSAYWKDGDFYLPDSVILACIKQSAAGSKKGKDIDRCVILSETDVVVTTLAKFKSIEAAFEDKRFVLSCQCKLPPKTGSLVWKARCMIPTGWRTTFTMEYNDELISEKSLIEINNNAGAMIGVGGWRPKFGRFTVETI